MANGAITLKPSRTSLLAPENPEKFENLKAKVRRSICGYQPHQLHRSEVGSRLFALPEFWGPPAGAKPSPGSPLCRTSPTPKYPRNYLTKSTWQTAYRSGMPLHLAPNSQGRLEVEKRGHGLGALDHADSLCLLHEALSEFHHACTRSSTSKRCLPLAWGKSHGEGWNYQNDLVAIHGHWH